jgi:hypothetical protein
MKRKEKYKISYTKIIGIFHANGFMESEAAFGQTPSDTTLTTPPG